MLKKILVFILLLVLVIVGYRLIKPKNSISTSTSDVASDISTNSTFTSTDFEDIAPTYVDSDSSYISNSHKTIVLSPTVAKFSCDGRQHCSQMTSCAEATYFIQHCPNTKMDGNHDGVPCEQQWCN